MNGTVVDWHRAGGCGWIRPDDKDERIHVSDAAALRATGRPWLERGLRVSFRLAWHSHWEKGRRATAHDVVVLEDQTADAMHEPIRRYEAGQGGVLLLRAYQTGTLKFFDPCREFGLVRVDQPAPVPVVHLSAAALAAGGIARSELRDAITRLRFRCRKYPNGNVTAWDVEILTIDPHVAATSIRAWHAA